MKKKMKKVGGLDVEMEGAVREGKVNYQFTVKKDYGTVGIAFGLELSIPEGMNPTDALEGTRKILEAELDRSGGTTIQKIQNFLDTQKRKR